jgi:hypothetical protein
LDDVFFGFSIKYSLNLKHPWAVRILNSTLYEVPHPFALLLIDGLFDVPYVLMLLFGLCIDEAITKVHFSEPFSLLLELRFSNLAVPEAVFQLFHGEVDRVLYVCVHANHIMLPLFLVFPSFMQIS